MNPIRCPVCGGDETQVLEVIDVHEQHRLYAPLNINIQEQLNREATKVTAQYVMHRCSACGLEFAWPLLAPPVSWYVLAYRALGLYPESRWEFDYVLDQLLRTDTVFEIGSGTGAFLRRCKERSIRASGIDFSADAISECRAQGLDAQEASLTDSSRPITGDSPTHIMAFHTLEHLDQPEALFAYASMVATASTQLWVAVPSFRRASRSFGTRDLLDEPPHHMTRWNEQALHVVGKASGWDLKTIIFEPLGLRTRLWTIATNMRLYRNLRRASLFSTKIMERFIRWCLYPIALLRAVIVNRDLTGFSMLARFQKR